MRVESDKPLAKGGWIHRLGDTLPSLPPREVKPEKRPYIDWQAKADQMVRNAAGQLGRLADELGVSAASLEALGVGIGYDEFRNRSFWSFPERNPHGRVTGIVRRFFDGEKKTMKWSRSGLYFEQAWQDHPGPIFLCEGGSDTAALITLGLSALGRPSNIGGVDLLTLMLGLERRRRVVVLGEHDEAPHKRGLVPYCPKDCPGCGHCFPGWYGAKSTAEKLAKALRRPVHYTLSPNGTKDVRQWLNLLGRPGGWREFVNAAERERTGVFR